MVAHDYFKRLATKSPVNLRQNVLGVLEDYDYERSYQLETRTEVAIADLDISDKDKQEADKYKPTRKRYFWKLMEQMQVLNGGGR